MTSRLPINLEDLLRQGTVEGERVAYRADWKPDPILRTICPFSSDSENTGISNIVSGRVYEGSGQVLAPNNGHDPFRQSQAQDEAHDRAHEPITELEERL